ncbi:hypothetical protein TNCV_4726241 [Trichonephila clavipes]|nr:hypothetical protein TNCV_4726241 [Trichonephila clavipes]
MGLKKWPRLLKSGILYVGWQCKTILQLLVGSAYTNPPWSPDPTPRDFNLSVPGFEEESRRKATELSVTGSVLQKKNLHSSYKLKQKRDITTRRCYRRV